MYGFDLHRNNYEPAAATKNLRYLFASWSGFADPQSGVVNYLVQFYQYTKGNGSAGSLGAASRSTFAGTFGINGTNSSAAAATNLTDVIDVGLDTKVEYPIQGNLLTDGLIYYAKV